MTEPIEVLYRDLIERWNERDAAGMAALFADDGESVGFAAHTDEVRRALAARRGMPRG